MKRKHICFCELILVLGMFSCKKQDANSSAAIYITNAREIPITSLPVDTSGASMGLNISSTILAGSDISATLEIDTSLVAVYNKTYAQNYSSPPDGSFNISNNLVSINQGASVSSSATLSVTSISGFKPGVNYMIPVSIKSAKGALRILDASRTVYVILKPIIRESVVNLAGYTSFNVPSFQTNTMLTSLTAITMECRVMMNNFQYYGSPYISSIMGISDEFAMRFGDGAAQNANRLQAYALYSNLVEDPTPYNTGQWYHLAYVYDGAAIKLYVNGALTASAAFSQPVNLSYGLVSGGFHLSLENGSRNLDGLMSEARVWTKALSQTEIQNGMCAVDPASPGLLAYWKLNDVTNNVAIDITGHGNDAQASNDVIWVPNVPCSN